MAIPRTLAEVTHLPDDVVKYCIMPYITSEPRLSFKEQHRFMIMDLFFSFHPTLDDLLDIPKTFELLKKKKRRLGFRALRYYRDISWKDIRNLQGVLYQIHTESFYYPTTFTPSSIHSLHRQGRIDQFKKRYYFLS